MAAKASTEGQEDDVILAVHQFMPGIAKIEMPDGTEFTTLLLSFVGNINGEGPDITYQVAIHEGAVEQFMQATGSVTRKIVSPSE